MSRKRSGLPSHQSALPKSKQTLRGMILDAAKNGGCSTVECQLRSDDGLPTLHCTVVTIAMTNEAFATEVTSRLNQMLADFKAEHGRQSKH